MRLARVIGSVACTRKEDSLEGVKLLLLRAVDERLAEYGESFAACDTVRAGTGDLVMFEAGREAAMALDNQFNPSDATVLGIVDRVDA